MYWHICEATQAEDVSYTLMSILNIKETTLRNIMQYNLCVISTPHHLNVLTANQAEAETELKLKMYLCHHLEVLFSLN